MGTCNFLKDDYASVGIPMLPSVKGSVFTAKAISRYGWATVLMSIMGVFALPEGVSYTELCYCHLMEDFCN